MKKIKNVKGIDDPPYILGVRSDYVILWILITSMVALAFLFIMFVALLQKAFLLTFLLFLFFMLAVGIVYFIMYTLSKYKPFKSLQNQPHIIRNQDLFKLSGYSLWSSKE